MQFYAGIDVSVKLPSVCVVDAKGAIVRETMVTTEPDALADLRQLESATY